MACRDNNPQAMMELYNISAKTVYNASLHIVMNEMDAEEIMQDSILKAFDNIGRFQGTEKDFVAFVKKIAVNKSIDWYRKNRKEPFSDQLSAVSECDIEDVDNEEEMRFTVEQLKERIDLLPDGYRMVINLHLIDELSFDEIAEIMNIKASTVRSQYFRAKEKLRKELTVVETSQ